MDLITAEQREQMLAHGRESAAGKAIDPHPVVKLFTPDANCTWLLTELDPDDPDITFGLCDLGLGEVELGSVSLGEIAQIRGRMRLPVERDRFFKAEGPLSAYAAQARVLGSIAAVKLP